MFPGLIWGKKKAGVVGRCDLVCVECFQLIQLMVVSLVSSLMVSMVLVLLGVGPILGNGYCFSILISWTLC